MTRTGRTLALGLVMVAALGACSKNDPKLMNLTSSTAGPDEFAIVPNKPLQAPDDFASLPEPTPGGTNRVDATPDADAIAALGGNPAVVARGSTAADNGLIGHTGRYGVASDIRQTLAAEDLDYRRRKDGRLLERLFNVNVYFRAYAPMSLDKYAELERFRALGVRTPTAPPPPQ